MSAFDEALRFVLEMEGGFVDDPADHGGATNHGITQATYDAWRDSNGQDRQSVREITDGEVQMIYHRDYWVPAGCESLPGPVAFALFDSAVNHGVGRAKKLLQRALGVAEDGVIGPNTMAAITEADPKALADSLLWVRVDFYYQISTGDQVKFLRGWLRRLLHLRKEIA